MYRRDRKRIINWLLFNETYELDKLKLSILSGNPDKDLLYKHPNYLKIRTSPAVKFEEETGIYGISREYKMPFGLNNIEIENIATIFKKDSEVITFLYRELIKLNHNLPITSEQQKMYDIICGACSKFNIDDIKDFIENKKELEKVPNNNLNLIYFFNKKDPYSIQYELIYNSIIEMGVKLNWFPSIETLDYIYKKLKKTI